MVDSRRTAIGLAAAGGLAAAHMGPSLALVSRAARRRLHVRARVATPGAVGLSFDDGPHRLATPAVLDLLSREGIFATFFLVGEQVRRAPSLVAEIAAAGHEVAIHCDRHRNLARLTPRQSEHDLDRALESISGTAGSVPHRYRPPYGLLTSAALRHARRQGWEVVLWTRDGRDWEARASSRSIASRCLDHIEAGDILLLHDSDAYSAPDSWRHTVDSVPRILEGLARRDLLVAPLGAGTCP